MVSIARVAGNVQLLRAARDAQPLLRTHLATACLYQGRQMC